MKKAIFMGSPDFAANILRKLVDSACVDIVAVFTQSAKKSGRGHELRPTEVEKSAVELGLPVFTPKSLRNEAAVSLIADFCADVILVAAYGLIIPQNILDIPKFGCINVHASLLPRWRGASPIHHAILNGDERTGITIMQMDAGIDTGDIISMRDIAIGDHNLGSLTEKLSDLGAEMLCDELKKIDFIVRTKQSEDGACYAHKMANGENQINWSMSCECVISQIRAFSPKPGSFSFLNGERVKILDAKIVDFSDFYEKKAGTIVSEDFFVFCGDGCVKILLIQAPGKNIVSGVDFLRNRSNLVGHIFADSIL